MRVRNDTYQYCHRNAAVRQPRQHAANRKRWGEPMLHVAEPTIPPARKQKYAVQEGKEWSFTTQRTLPMLDTVFIRSRTTFRLTQRTCSSKATAVGDDCPRDAPTDAIAGATGAHREPRPESEAPSAPAAPGELPAARMATFRATRDVMVTRPKRVQTAGDRSSPGCPGGVTAMRTRGGGRGWGYRRIGNAKRW